MSKKGSIIKQTHDKLQQIRRIGKSRNEGKKVVIKLCDESKIIYNPFKREFQSDGIFGIRTFEQYENECLKFARWLSEQGIKDLDDVLPYHVKEYLEYKIARRKDGYSPYTIQTWRAALTKLTGFSANDIQLDKNYTTRSYQEIKKGRDGPSSDMAKIDTSKYTDLTMICRGTGARRHEIDGISGDFRDPNKVLTTENIFKGSNGSVYARLHGKGGKTRITLINPDLQQQIWDLKELKERQGQAAMYEKVPKRLNVHSFRREYVKAFYKMREEEKEKKGVTIEKLFEEDHKNRYRNKGYTCKVYVTKEGEKYDKEILSEISHNIGHGSKRCYTIVRSYMH